MNTAVVRVLWIVGTLVVLKQVKKMVPALDALV